MLHAMLFTPATIEGITEINNGVRPDDELMKSENYFVYSCDPEKDIVPEILSRDEFYKKYAFRDTWNNDNTVRRI